MENKIKDKIFGEMEYKYSWTKKDSFLFLEHAFIVNITAQAYKGDNILESQQTNYANYKIYLAEHKTEIEEKLIEYFKTTYKVEALLRECLTPKTIIFERDNSWGVIFDTAYDVENGVALFVINNEINIGPQDLYL